MQNSLLVVGFPQNLQIVSGASLSFIVNPPILAIEAASDAPNSQPLLYAYGNKWLQRLVHTMHKARQLFAFGRLLIASIAQRHVDVVVQASVVGVGELLKDGLQIAGLLQLDLRGGSIGTRPPGRRDHGVGSRPPVKFFQLGQGAKAKRRPLYRKPS